MKRSTNRTFTWRRFTENRLFFPLVALSLILLFDFIFIPGFFNIENRDGNLHGSLVDILRNGSTVMLLAIGMTLVIATGVSYGGGMSTMLAFLKDRVRLPDGSFAPWTSPNGTPIRLTVDRRRFHFFDPPTGLVTVPDGSLLVLLRTGSGGISRQGHWTNQRQRNDPGEQRHRWNLRAGREPSAGALELVLFE